MLQREKHRKKEKIQRQRNRNYSMTTTRNNYLTILQFLMIMIRSHKKLNRQSTKAVLLMKNVLMRNVPWSTHTFTLTLQESWFLIKALRLYIQNTSCLQRSKLWFWRTTPLKTQLQGRKIVSTLSYENIVQDVALMKHFTGLKPSQFEVLHDFLDDVKSFFNLTVCLPK